MKEVKIVIYRDLETVRAEIIRESQEKKRKQAEQAEKENVAVKSVMEELAAALPKNITIKI